jgi:hypothetical protein
MHGLGKEQLSQRFTQWRAPGFPRDYHVLAAPPQQPGNTRKMRALSSAVDSFQADELSASHEVSTLKNQRDLLFRPVGSWYFATARLCSVRVRENSLVPSPRDTKYNASVSAGCITALIDARPGMAMG